MLLLHTDVFLTTREVVLQRAFGELRAGPGPPQIAAAVLLHRDPLFSKSYFFFSFFKPGGLHPPWASRDKVGGRGVEWGGREGGGGKEGEGERGKGGVCRGRSTNLGLSASPALVRTSR